MSKTEIGQKWPEIKEQLKIGGTVYLVSHIFDEKRDKQAAWLSIVTRSEGLKTGQSSEV